MNDPIPLPQSPAHLPPSLSRLWELTHNLWWSWNPEARALFETLDRTLWKLTAHNPVKLLRDLSPERMQSASTDPSFLRRYEAVLMAFDIETVTGTLIASISVNIGMWLERFTIVVPSLSNPRAPLHAFVYWPSWVEWSLMAGCFAAFALLYMGFTKLFPIISIWELAPPAPLGSEEAERGALAGLREAEVFERRNLREAAFHLQVKPTLIAFEKREKTFERRNVFAGKFSLGARRIFAVKPRADV